jgi:iron complex transport system substrate-binding protein
MTVDRRKLMASGAGLAASLAAGRLAAQGQDRLIIDAIGLHSRLQGPAQRVVIATHYAHEDFTAVAGASGWSRVVGLSREPWADWRAATFAHYARAIPGLADLPDIGILGVDIDAGKIIALKPDVVLMDVLSGSHAGEELRALRAADIPVVFIEFRSGMLRAHEASVAAIGRVMGTEGRAGEIIDLYSALHSDTMNRTGTSPDFGERSCYVELAEQGPDTIGFTDMNRLWGGIVQGLGGRNIARGIPDHGGPLPQEILFKEDPDLMIFAGSSWSAGSNGVRTGFDTGLDETRKTLAAYAARTGYEALKAVKSGAVHAVEHNLAWSLRDVFAMQYIAKQLYPEAFADIDPAKGLADFHARFLPVPLSGTWFARL